MSPQLLNSDRVDQPIEQQPGASDKPDRHRNSRLSLLERAGAVLGGLGASMVLFFGGMAVGQVMEPAVLVVQIIATVGGLFLFIGSVLALNVGVTRLRQATERYDSGARVLEQVEALLERVRHDLQAAERHQYLAAEKRMPSGRELDAVAAKLPYPKEWYEESFDPF